MNQNPLVKHFRQPKIYLRLPSKGYFYDSSVLEKTENDEYPVLAMTAKDEIKIKTPDALLNGQATVDVIQSCIPNIKNAWRISNIDLDAILIAIRIATYGETMDLTFTLPNTELERTYQVDLRLLLDQLIENEFDHVIVKDNFKIEISPLTYKDFTETALKTFEQQRILKVLNDEGMSEDEKLRIFNESFEKLTNINIETVLKSIVSIQYDDEPTVTNKEHIAEFFNNIDKDFFQLILSHTEEQKKKFSTKPLTVMTTAEEQNQGAPAEFTVPVSFDQSNFFVKGS
jgi:hypothetical protein